MSRATPAMASLSRAVPPLPTAMHIHCRARGHTLRCHDRSFSTSRSARAVTAETQMPKNIMKQVTAQQGMRSRMKNMSRQEIPNDLGLLPRTLIRPPAQDLPKLFGADWKQRLKFEWLWIRTRFQNFFTYALPPSHRIVRRQQLIAYRLFYFLRWNRPKAAATKRKTKPPWSLVERTLVARNLHRQYYVALAEGDVSTIKKIACRGLIQSSERRIGQRRDGDAHSFQIMQYIGVKYPQVLRWPLLSFLPFSATKIVSDKIAPLPFGKNNLLRQCVVRVRTRQRLDRHDGIGPRIADLSEYVVLQRMRIEEQDEGWKLWGTTQPSTREEIDRIVRGSPTTPRFRDTVQGQLSRLTGM